MGYASVKVKQFMFFFKDGLKEKVIFFYYQTFFSLQLILKEEHVSDQKMV